MYKLRAPICIWLFILCSLQAVGQGDKWTGTWHMDYTPTGSSKTISMEWQISEPTNKMLYPSLLKIDYGSFSGSYEVLLCKKNDHELGIGRNKYPISEAPFKIGAWMLYLNGTLDFKPNGLSVERMWINSFELYMQGFYHDDEIYAMMKDYLRELLSKKPILLKKKDNIPWQSPDTRRMAHPEGDSVYFGVYDKITVYDSIIPVFIRDEDVDDKDTVTFVHNGKTLLNKEYVSPGGSLFQVKLDTGMNILGFFADNYGRLPPNTGSFRIKTDSLAAVYDFRDKSNYYSTFLVAQVYRKVKPQPPAPPTPPVDKRVIERRNNLLDQITVGTGDVELELWDDAAEDGDSISIRLNEKYIVSGFPVLKRRQKLSVTLQPGENRMILLADNLGSIPPNTAVMKITAGKIRKYVRIKTDLKQNNLLMINYTP
ncbi:hypothetical protein [Chitinophaga sancti]|uniref:Uncharacterized protein n=1 Tax=Chitinophaga sancti TaxID=1004 RepID=A0A1K1QLW6_9BACT|nr:hypothetical protein [Chitinophaga sancti]WQD65126.1 hypothetical protein U0033_12040 [Chitinophaga sancti]WQG89250.1 hypothetical protein SR876_30430 [Chitinophaga sancti]SFW60773.1 hypothetical protein SAMN05661012_02907 [Chitinophaga sancti]